MQATTKTIEVFIAVDGREFLTEEECIVYEAQVVAERSRRDSIKHFAVYYRPDLTEGRGYQAVTLIAVEPHTYIDGRYFLENFMRAFTEPVVYVQGVAPIPGYVMEIIDEEAFINNRTFAQIGSYKRYAERLFISENGTPLEGYPEPCPTNVTLKEVIESFIEKNVLNK